MGGSALAPTWTFHQVIIEEVSAIAIVMVSHAVPKGWTGVEILMDTSAIVFRKAHGLAGDALGAVKEHRGSGRSVAGVAGVAAVAIVAAVVGKAVVANASREKEVIADVLEEVTAQEVLSQRV